MALDERIDDLELLHRWRSGDARAGDRLLARHFWAVYRFFRSKVGAAALELAQATFEACPDPDEGSARAGFKPLVFGIARRRLLDHLAALRPGVTLDPRVASLPSWVEPQTREALHDLSLDLQIAIELHHGERMSVADVADVLGLGAGAVKGRLARARKVVAVNLDGAAFDADGQRAWALVRARLFDDAAAVQETVRDDSSAPRSTGHAMQQSALGERG